jgi:predicted acyltransferase
MSEGSELRLVSASATAFARPLAYESLLKPAVEERYITLDACRGAVMVLVVSGVFGLAPLAAHPGDVRIPAWFNHAAWDGVLLWDLALPAFLFMAGVALTFALARRRATGASSQQLGWHVASRSLKLILLSQILQWMATGKLQLQLQHALSQIALAYFFAFLIVQLKFRWQVVAAALILAGDWALFVLFPGPDGAFSRTQNIAAVIDRAILGHNYADAYVTISFIGATVTTVFGAWTGALLRTQRMAAEKAKILAVAAIAGLAGGKALSLVNPMIKRLWTPSFTLYSTGWALLIMLLFILMIDVWGHKRWAFPLVVVGMNSLLVFSVGVGPGGWIDRSLGVTTGQFRFGSPVFPVAGSCAFLCLLWSLCYVLYRSKIYIKL